MQSSPAISWPLHWLAGRCVLCSALRALRMRPLWSSCQDLQGRLCGVPTPTWPPLPPCTTCWNMKARTGHSTIAITADGTPTASGVSRDSPESTTLRTTLWSLLHDPLEKLVTAPVNTSLHDCNNIIWDNKIDALPLVDKMTTVQYMVFRKDYRIPTRKMQTSAGCQQELRCGAAVDTRGPACACSGGGWRGCAVHRLLRGLL